MAFASIADVDGMCCLLYFLDIKRFCLFFSVIQFINLISEGCICICTMHIAYDIFDRIFV